MKVREFFEKLRQYPDWDVDLVIESDYMGPLIDIEDIVADERNGNLIIVKKEGTRNDEMGMY